MKWLPEHPIWTPPVIAHRLERFVGYMLRDISYEVKGIEYFEVTFVLSMAHSGTIQHRSGWHEIFDLWQGKWVTDNILQKICLWPETEVLLITETDSNYLELGSLSVQSAVLFEVGLRCEFGDWSFFHTRNFARCFISVSSGGYRPSGRSVRRR